MSRVYLEPIELSFAACDLMKHLAALSPKKSSILARWCECVHPPVAVYLLGDYIGMRFMETGGILQPFQMNMYVQVNTSTLLLRRNRSVFQRAPRTPGVQPAGIINAGRVSVWSVPNPDPCHCRCGGSLSRCHWPPR